MKKLIFYTFTTLITFSAFSQSAGLRMAAEGTRPQKGYAAETNLEKSTFYNSNVTTAGQAAAMSASNGFRSSEVTVVPLGQAGNMLTVSSEGPNQVSYVSDINSVTFTHRQTNGIPGGSGGVDIDYSTDGGASFTTNVHVTPDYNSGVYSGQVSGNRFPNGTIYNPAGNTNPNNAYNIFLGIAHDPTSVAGAWGWQYQGSSKFDGTSVDENYIQWDGTSVEYIPAGLDVTSTGVIYGISPTFNNTVAAGGANDNDYLNFQKLRLIGGTFISLTESVLWARQDWVPDLYQYIDPADATLENYAGFDYNIAFAPDGMTGYAVLIGAASTDAIVYPHPLVTKTIDGGLTWSDLPAFDFTSLVELQDFLALTPTGDAVPYCGAIDMTVDSDGRLHIFSETSSKSTSNNTADSLFFISGFDDGSGGFLNYTCMIHFTTTDGTDWTAKNIDNFIESTHTLPGTSLLPTGFRPQASRTEDGSRVFFTWLRSDTVLTNTNDIPDVMAVGYDPSTELYTPNKNITAGTDMEYQSLFPTISPKSITDGDDHKYEIPIVVCKNSGTTEDTTNFYYLKGAGFEEAEFGGAPAPVANFTYAASPTGATYNFTNSSSDATSYSWDFGDGIGTSVAINPIYTYAASGEYTVCLTAMSASGEDTNCKDIDVIIVGINDINLGNTLHVFPSPSNGMININIENGGAHTATVEVLNMIGDAVMASIQMTHTLSLDLGNLANGNYMVKVISDNGAVAVRQITIAK